MCGVKTHFECKVLLNLKENAKKNTQKRIFQEKFDTLFQASSCQFLFHFVYLSYVGCFHGKLVRSSTLEASCRLVVISVELDLTSASLLAMQFDKHVGVCASEGESSSLESHVVQDI